MSQQATLTLEHDDRTTLDTPDGDRRQRRQQLGRSPYCRQPASIDDQPRDLDHPRDCCQHCGSQVTERYRRVLGDQDDIAHSCPQCEDVSQRERFMGLAADADRDIPRIRKGSAATGGTPE